jgi:putative ABC transport system permease protein
LIRQTSAFRVGLTIGIQGLRRYRSVSLLLGSALLAGIATVLPLASLFGRHGDWFGFRPMVHFQRGDNLGLPWVMDVAGPSAAQQEAASSLGSLLLLALIGAVLVALVTILTLASARLSQLRTERLIHRAVGASRRTLLSAAVAETIMVATIPVFAGGLIGAAAAHAAVASWPGSLVAGTPTVMLGATGLLLLAFAGVLVGSVFIQPRRILAAEMHEPLPTFPVVFQVAICFVVLAIGGLLAVPAQRLWIGKSGRANGTVVSLSMTSRSAQLRSEQFRHLLDSLKAAGMQSVSLTSPGTLAGLGYVAMVLTDCGQCSENGLNMSVRLKPATHKIVSSDTFRLTGLPVLEGRGIVPGDDWQAARVAVVSRSLAGREFQDGNPIGRRINTGDDGGEGSTVVGVVDDLLPTGLGGTFQPRYAVYVSVLQHPPESVDLLIRDPVNRGALREALDSAVVGGTGHYTITTERALREAELAPVRWFRRVFTLQGWGLIGLAWCGIVAFMRLWVRSLAGEIGIRRSVGARRYRVFGWVVGRAIGVAGKGVFAGVWFGMGVWQMLPQAVAGAGPHGVSDFLPYAILMVGVVLSGVLVSAWRTSRARPAELLQLSG